MQMMATAGDRRVIRTECLGQYNNYQVPSIVIVPKEECCRHYDAYMHTSFVVNDFITSSRVPPLFIPNGFFEGRMKIRYGFDDYDQSYVNINPIKSKYFFESPDGTDLAISLDRVPVFWQNRIARLEINPNFEDVRENQGSTLALDVIDPWRAKSEGEIRLVVLYRRLFYSSIGSFFRNLVNFSRKTIRATERTVRRI